MAPGIGAPPTVCISSNACQTSPPPAVTSCGRHNHQGISVYHNRVLLDLQGSDSYGSLNFLSRRITSMPVGGKACVAILNTETKSTPRRTWERVCFSLKQATHIHSHDFRDGMRLSLPELKQTRPRSTQIYHDRTDGFCPLQHQRFKNELKTSHIS